MNVDLNSGWNYWPVMKEQVDDLRGQYNILPLETFEHAHTVLETETC